MDDVVTVGRVGQPTDFATAWSALLDLHQGKAWTAWVDAFSDYDDSNELSTEARAAMEAIRARTKTGMAVELAIDDAEDRQLVDAFGPYSIHAIVGPTATDGRFGVHDGTSLWFTAGHSDMGRIREALRERGVDVDDAYEVWPADPPPPRRALWIAAAVVIVLAVALLIWPKRGVTTVLPRQH